ncbi:MAG: type 2 isopentenyl-diphosphate Delta-isomerase [Dehalococcoidia bacterium]|jgi:isopentenyl-diphosphate delta-isomerase
MIETKKVSPNSRRKEEHLRIALNEDVAFRGLTTGFEEYYLLHQALPELDLRNVDLSTTFLGRSLRAPLVISPMVGGVEEAAHINRNLATAAQAAGIAMSVGSLRCAIEDPTLAATYRVRNVAPDVLLFANLGAVQLNRGYGPRECRAAMEMVQADALTLHLNPLQEALQSGGDTDFAGLTDRIAAVCEALDAPVFVKEVGWGISDATARRLIAAGVAGIDVAGAGGTCWSEVERLRANDEKQANVAGAFTGWGIPTAESIRLVRQVAPELPLIASGGIRTGVDVAKALALGADIAGIATPLLKAANESAERAREFIDEVVEGLRIAMFCAGIGSIDALKRTPCLKRRAME